jgi:hypothetical protein
MQLSAGSVDRPNENRPKDNRVRLALAAATSVLLGGADAQAAGWTFDTQLLYYSEADRVTAIEPVVSARWNRGDGQALNLKLTVDSLTGASASGATPSARVQTYTTPSGHSSYSTRPGETPLDNSFLDTRWALNVNWERPLSALWKATLGANVSTEYDYGSAAISGSLARDFNQRNTTLSLAVSLGYDSVDPVGGVPRPLSGLSPLVPDDAEPVNRLDGSDTKSLYDVLIGVTQILDRRALVQINYSVGRSSGYLDQLYESRPDARTKQGLYLAYKRQTRLQDVADLSYRYHFDDWGIRSHTLDLRYRWDLAGAGYLQPHVRYYEQTAADFYARFLVAGEPLPAHASADYRLGELTGTTLGLKYGRPRAGSTFDGREWNVKLEYYQQSGREPDVRPGVLAGFDLFPTVEAVMVQFGYTF